MEPTGSGADAHERMRTTAGPSPPRSLGALRDSEGLARAVFESASEGIVIVDEAGAIVMVNARTEALFGYPRQELIGQTLERLVPERVHDAHAAHRRLYAAAPRIRPMGQGRDVAGRRKDGSEFPLEISLSFAETDTGKWTAEEQERIVKALEIENGVIDALQKLIEEIENRPP